MVARYGARTRRVWASSAPNPFRCGWRRLAHSSATLDGGFTYGAALSTREVGEGWCAVGVAGLGWSRSGATVTGSVISGGRRRVAVGALWVVAGCGSQFPEQWLWAAVRRISLWSDCGCCWWRRGRWRPVSPSSKMMVWLPFLQRWT